MKPTTKNFNCLSPFELAQLAIQLATYYNGGMPSQYLEEALVLWFQAKRNIKDQIRASSETYQPVLNQPQNP